MSWLMVDANVNATRDLVTKLGSRLDYWPAIEIAFARNKKLIGATAADSAIRPLEEKSVMFRYE